MTAGTRLRIAKEDLSGLTFEEQVVTYMAFVCTPESVWTSHVCDGAVRREAYRRLSEQRVITSDPNRVPHT